MEKRVVIIGGGVGGLACGIRLRCLGYAVTIFEKNEVVGGKLASRTTDGGYVDLGPTLLTMLPVFEDLFEVAGADLHKELDLRPIDPSCRYHWSDGTVFNTWESRGDLLEEASRVFPDDVEGLTTFLDDVSRLYNATEEIFLKRPFRGLRELFTLENLKLGPLLGSLGFTSTMARTLERRFSDPKLIQLLGRFATYNGSSPYRAPATLNLIAHVELTLGAYYPRGGMRELAHALQRLAEGVGVRIETSAEVERVVRGKSDRSVSAVIVHGEEHPCDLMISNVDALWTWRHLLAPSGLPIPKRIESAERSCSGFLMTGSVSKPDRFEQSEAHHQIYFSDDYQTEFREIFEEDRLATDMTIYRSIPSVTDPDLATGERRGCYLLVNAPQGIEIPRAEEYAGRVLQRLQAFGITQEMSEIEIMTPESIEKSYGSIGGAIYGSSSNSIFSAFLRPTNQVPGLDNVYMVGGSVHPGGGLPLVALSGAIVAQQIEERYR